MSNKKTILPDSRESVKKAQELMAKPPEGFRRLEGDELKAFHDRSMRMDYFRRGVEIQETRLREHQNGAEAAKYALRDAISQWQIVQKEVSKEEAKLGITNPNEDIKISNQDIFIRVKK